MRKLFILMIALFLVAGATWAQTVTIGTGTSTQRYPLGAYFGYERSASIYTAAEIGQAGVISKLAWYATIARSTSIPLKIYLKETSASTFTAGTWASMISDATLVWDATNTSITASAWNEFTLTTSFSYGGVNNLVVMVESNFGGTGSGTSSGTGVRYSSATTQHQYWQQDNTAPTGNGTTTSNRPNIQITLAPANMAFTAATTLTASTLPVLPGATDQPVVALQVQTTGTLNAFDLTSVTFNTTGTTNVSDLTAARVYYTSGTTFSTSNQFGTTITNPSGALTFTGTLPLNGGSNYFWLCYDISNSATIFNVVDATCSEFITSEPATRTPTATDPAGNRAIRTALSGIYTIDNTLPTSGTNYNNFTDAINDLNSLPLAGPVTYNVTAGQTFSSTVPASPYNYAYAILNIGTATNTITFQRNGAGLNPVISVIGSSATNDIGMFLYGTDYISFDGIDITDAGTTSADYLENGYYLQGPADDNCKYVSIQNCVIDLNAANTSSKGIYAYANAPTSSANANSNNIFRGNTIQDSYNGIYLSGNISFPDVNNFVNSNIIQNIGSNLSTAIYPFYATYQSDVIVSDNTVSNVTGSGSIYGMYFSSLTGSNNAITGNILTNQVGTATSSTMYGLYYSPSSGAIAEISGNSIYGLDHKYNVYGLYISGGNVNNVFRNKVYNVAYTGTSSYIAYGLSSSGGTTNNIYNNFVYDIKAPASTTNPGTRAFNLNGGTTANVYYNTVYIDYVSTVASNQSAALYVTTAPTTLNMNNNIFINKCDMTVGTRAVAFYKSSTALTNLANSVNNNLYYAGTPGTKNLIYYNGTTVYQTLADYQAHVTPRENLSVTENVAFTSSVSPYNLHIPNSTSTVAESGGLNISGITSDFDGDIRQGNPGYSGTGVSTDIGADEFAGNNPNLATLDMGATALVSPASAGCFSAAETVTVTIKNYGTQTINFGANPVTVTTEITGAVTQTMSSVISTGTLAPGMTQNVNMTGTLNMTTAGVYTFNAHTMVTGDGGATNDAMSPATRTVLVTVSLPQTVDFTGFTGTNLTTVFPNWYEATGATVPAGTTSLWSNAALGGTDAKINLYTTSRVEWLVGPKFVVNSGDALKFKIAITDFAALTPDAEGMQGTDDKVMVKISTDCGLSYSTLYTFDASNTASITNVLVDQTIDLSSYAGQAVIIAFQATDGPIDNAPDYDFHLDDIFIGQPPATPTLTVNPITLACGYAANGSYSAEKIYVLSGEALTGAPGNVTVTAPANFEVSLTSGAGFASSVNVPYTSPTLLSTNIYVRCAPTAANTYYTGNVTNAAPGAATVNVAVTGNSDVFNSYCIPTYSSGGSTDFVTQVTLGTLSQATSANTSPYYISYIQTQNAIPDLEAGTTNALSLTFSTDANQYNGVWIDFNQNGLFETSEFFTSGTNAGSGGTATVNIVVPTGATLGNTLMRIRGGEDSQVLNTQACGASSSSYGQAQDYKVNITPSVSPALGVNPTSINFGSVPSGNTSAEFSYVLTGQNLSPASGDITITPPANFEVSSVTGGPYSASPITVAYTGGTLTATIYAVFKPTSPSTAYSGNIVNSGGTAADINVAVSGISPCEVVSAINENFDAVTTPALPQCWSKYTAPAFSFQTVTTITTSPNSAPNSVSLYSSGATAAIDAPMLISPAISNLSAGTNRLRFYAKGASTNLSVIVGTMSDPLDASTFTALETVTGLNTSTWTEVIVDFSTYSGSDQYIAFKHPLTTTYSNVYIDDVYWEIIPTATLSWYNLQWPGTADIFANQNVTVYAQCWESGVTEAAGPGTGIECWIGYSTDPSSPDTWTNWIPASYNFGVDPNNNDEYQVALGAAQGLAPGTYYYASRFRYLSGPFTYGGFNGGPWDGTSNISGVLTVNAVPAANLPFSESFESGQGNWLSVNGTQVNQWHVGEAVAKTGTKSAYISNDGGVSNAYTITSTSRTHIYRDITFPAGTNDFDFSFSWKGLGETGLYDYLQVFIVPTSTIPVAGTALTSGQVGVNYYNQANWQDVALVLDDAVYAGQTWRVVFSWRNDGLDGTQPPVAIDDIVIEEQAPLTKTLNLTGVMLEGLYAGGGLLNSAKDDVGGDQFPGFADQITVELHDGSNYSSIVHTAIVLLSNTGSASVADIPGTLNGDYYITIKHRNSITTVSADAVSFSNAIVSQSFATPADVLGGNLQLMVDNGYAIFGGDVNQDGTVDTSDMTDVDNDATNYVAGYVPSDVDGNGGTDTSDMTIVDNNSTLYVGAVTP
ncbi:MAG: choice-of-anchor J domain-containing protein [Bacteroidales bacterium]|nr:choice-of-anchor J domain-containing protein [Bacteroidales bacterium]